MKITVLSMIVGLWLQVLPGVAGGVGVEGAWARASLVANRPGVVFATIVNHGGQGDVLVAVETPVAGVARVHLSKVTNGVASMTAVGPVEIPANGQVKLAPGGLHIMLMKLKRRLVKGTTIPLTLVFEKAGRVDVMVPVLGFGARGPEQ